MKAKRKIAMLMTVCMVMTLLTGIFSLGSVTVSAVYPDPNGKYVTVSGAGLKNGSSWEDAYSSGSFQAAWNATPANGTLYLGSGLYSGSREITTSTSGQDSANPKKMLGVDTGAGKPVVKSGYSGTNQSSKHTFLTISSGVSNISVENIRIENYYRGIMTGGNQSYISMKDIDVYVTCYGFYLNGGGTDLNTLKLSNLTIDSCNFYYYTKSGVRLYNRTEDALITNCVADAGGVDYWYDGNWPVGFEQRCDSDTPNMAENRITYVDCTAKNSYVLMGDTEYWNGDGFTTERNAQNMSYIRCKAYGNTDGGWDCKAATIALTDCIGMDNKRNIRLWGIADVTNCLATYSYRRGGGYSSVGIWSGGPVTANFCTFYNNQSAQVETDTGLGGSITLNDCIVGTSIFGKTLYSGGAITKNRTLDYNIESCTVDPLIKAYENSYFYGDDDRYNSQVYGNTKGYYCVTTNEYTTPTPEPVTPTPVPSPGVTNLLCDNFDRYIDLADVSAGGWSMVTPTPTTVASPILAATEAPVNYKYFRTVPSTSATRTFAPVALKAAGGSSPGKNAKLVVAFDAFTSSGTGAEQGYWKVQDSSTGNNAVSAGRRGSTAAVRYSKSIPSPFVGLTISNGLSRFTRLKFVIKITDGTGAFLAAPKVDIYCDDMNTPITGGVDVNMIDSATTKVDKFYLGGSLTKEVDNLSITLETCDKDDLSAKLTTANALYTTASANIGTTGGKYLQADVDALATAITNAQTVYNNASATQTDVDAQETALQAAIDDCTPIPIDKSVLSAKLTAANTLYTTASANIGTTGGKYLQADVDALAAAITAGQSVYNNANATQDAVDTAAANLQTAIDDCTPIPVDKSALSAKLTDANALYAIANANIGTDYGQYGAAAVSALSAAIATAQAVYDNGSATQDAVDAEVVNLQTAMAPCTPRPTPIVTVLLNDDFNGYADIAAMQSAGWTVNLDNSTTPPGSPALMTTAAPAYAQYFKVIASTSATRTFAPVVLQASGGSSPGKNAKLTIYFDGYIGGTAGSNYQSYFKVSNATSGYVAVSAGRRNATASIKYTKSIASSGDTSPVIISSAPRFTKFKFVIKITDETGAFLTGGPKVDVYAADMDTPVTTLTDVNMLDTATASLDKFYLGGTQQIEVDNLNISLQTDV